MKAQKLSNAALAKRLRCSTNYISGIRNGQVPGQKLGIKICRFFPGKITLQDLGIKLDALLAVIGDVQTRKAS